MGSVDNEANDSEEEHMIHIYCGDGKGKTTAALGLILRHVGAGGKAVLAQFLKSTPTGELAALERLGVPVYRNDLPRLQELCDELGIYIAPSDDALRELLEGGDEEA